jgi:hypothetical protein
MQGLNFLIVGLIQLGIAIYGSFKIRGRFTVYAVLTLIVVYGLAYDNLSIAAGAILAEGDLLRALNIPRYLIHALTTPTMIISAFGALRLTGSKFAQSKLWHTVTCVVVTLLIALGSYENIFKLTLAPEMENGVTRYINTFDLFKGPPIPAVGTVILVLIFGILLWKNTKFPWLFIAAALEFAAAGAIGFLLLQNIGEIAFAAGLVATQIFAAQYQEAKR